jgi:cytochrome oxidase assembly protein ShyY1
MGNAEFVRGNLPPLLAYLDLDALEREARTPLARAVLQLAPDAGHGFTRRWQALPGTMPPERHRAYAVQWFALALLVPITLLVLRWRR